MKFGNYEVQIHGARRFNFHDPYRVAVALTWTGVVTVLLGIELLLNLIFATLYLLSPGSIANAHSGSLTDAFFFSIETLATVGYGEMYPADLYGHVISAVEIVTGVGFAAVVTGLIFVRVAKPRSRFRYSDALVITQHRGHPTLMLRVASDGPETLYDAEATLSVLLEGREGEDHGSRSVVDLSLLRPRIPVFALSWTLMHVIDDTSPLAGLIGPTIVSANLTFFVMMRAEDASLTTTVRDLRAYHSKQIHLGMRFADAILIDGEGRPILDLDRLGELESDFASKLACGQ